MGRGGGANYSPREVGFNASFATLNKGMKSRANVFKCKRRAEAPMEKEPQQTCSICRQKGSISSSEVSETMICCRK